MRIKRKMIKWREKERPNLRCITNHPPKTFVVQFKRKEREEKLLVVDFTKHRDVVESLRS